MARLRQRFVAAQMWYVPSRDVTITLMSNRGNQSLRLVVQQLLAVLFEGS